MEISSPTEVVPELLLDRLRGIHPRIPVTLGLVGINIAIFVAMLYYGAGLWHTSSEVQLAWGANFGPATKDGQWWRLGTALFLHFGLIHLSMNMLALWDVGRLVERMVGSTRFFLLYFLSGICGNLLSLIARGEHAISGGASGAIFGIYGALLVGLWQQRQYLHPQEFRLLFWGGISFAAAMIVIAFFLPFIDNAAHVGGLVAGTVIGIALHRPLGPARSIALPIRLVASVLMLVVILLMMANIGPPRYRWSEELGARREISNYLRQDAAISSQWQSLMQPGQSGEGASFEQLAGAIENNVANRYEDSFEQISQIHVDPAAPSAAALAMLRKHAQLRRDASRTMVEGLRNHDEQKIRAAKDLVQQSREIVPDGKAAPGVTSPHQSDKQ